MWPVRIMSPDSGLFVIAVWNRISARSRRCNHSLTRTGDAGDESVHCRFPRRDDRLVRSRSPTVECALPDRERRACRLPHSLEQVAVAVRGEIRKIEHNQPTRSSFLANRNSAPEHPSIQSTIAAGIPHRTGTSIESMSVSTRNITRSTIQARKEKFPVGVIGRLGCKKAASRHTSSKQVVNSGMASKAPLF